MSHLAMQVPWRDFLRVVRKLGYAAQKKAKTGSKRYFFDPARSPNSVSLREPHAGDTVKLHRVWLGTRTIELPSF